MNKSSGGEAVFEEAREMLTAPKTERYSAPQWRILSVEQRVLTGIIEPSPAPSPEGIQHPVLKRSSPLSGQAGILLGYSQDHCRSQEELQRRHEQ